MSDVTLVSELSVDELDLVGGGRGWKMPTHNYSKKVVVGAITQINISTPVTVAVFGKAYSNTDQSNSINF